ncbi:MAG TPA: tetratricopeptide repeat protein [Candidatus Acidoferrales bacterium]|nr:tetratricopeptide repeat protein [Candidatus Acidoferrales bacterium]
MAVRDRMLAHRTVVVAALAMAALTVGCAFPLLVFSQGAETQSSSAPGSQSDSQTQTSQPSNSTQPQPEGTSSSKPGHRSGHRVRVEEEVPPPPELSQAEALIQKQDYASAEPLLLKATESDPGNYVAWFDLGFVENKLGRMDESIAAYRKSVAAKPDVFESNLNLGIQLAKAGQPEAEQFLRTATQLKPTAHVAEGQERAWLSLAHVLEATKPEEAIAAYRKAAALEPKDAEPHLGAGLLLEKQERFSDAVEEYKQALALDPTPDALTGLANIYMRGRRFPEAEECLRKLVAARPDEAAAHVQLGRVLAAEEKKDEAIAELQTGAKLAPADQSVQRDLAELYSAAGKNDQAEAVYRGLVAAHPNEAELHRGLGASLLRQKKFREAQQEFLAAVKLKPDFGEAYGDLAFAASENHDYVLALKALDARAKFLPEVPPTYFLRASAYDHLQDVKQAVANYHLFLNTANGKYPDQEWQAKHRLIALEPKKK